VTVGAETVDVAGVVAVSSPVLTVSAATPAGGPVTSAATSTLGAIEVLDLPIGLDGGLSAGSSVLGSGATSSKAFELRNLALPPLCDLLEALNPEFSFDLLGQIVPEVLAQLVSGLGLPVSSELQALLDDLDDLLAEGADLQSQLADAEAALAAAEQELQDAIDDAEAALSTALGLLEPPLSLEAFRALDDATRTTLLGLAPQLVPLYEDLLEAEAAVVDPALQAAVDTLEDALDDLGLLLDDLLDEIAALRGQLVAALDGVELLSLDKLSVLTSAKATSASPGGQSAEVVGGELAGLNVLGTDVIAELSSVLGLADGDSSVDVAGLVGVQLQAVQAEIDRLLGILTDLLDGAVPGLVFPAIDVALLERTTSTAITDGFGVATAGLGGLRISLPAITVPDLTDFLPPLILAAGEGGVSAQDVTAQAVGSPVTLTFGVLTESARFRPAALTDVPTGTTTTTTTTPTSSAARLPATGAPALVAVLGLTLLAGAALVRRRTQEPAD
jgi:hypothetical protein